MGSPSRSAIALEAVGSVGATIAPSTNDSAQPRPGMKACATAATASIVTSTSPIARNPIAFMFARSSRSEVKNAPP